MNQIEKWTKSNIESDVGYLTTNIYIYCLDSNMKTGIYFTSDLTLSNNTEAELGVSESESHQDFLWFFDIIAVILPSSS